MATLIQKAIEKTMGNLFQQKIQEPTFTSSKTAFAHFNSDGDELTHRLERLSDKHARAAMARELELPVQTRFSDVFEFVDRVVVDLYGTQTSNEWRWCEQYYRHKPALRRLTLMWVTWENMRAEMPATGEEVWMRTIGDYHMNMLMGSRGPFTRCTTKHNPDSALAVVPLTQNLAEPDEDKE
ncbi:DUF4913 domain-containing protein [Corynebacterium suicordis]|uniref:DUF4913 domain-containing protein n=1 Tax=Corynebacterium suicordis DSM 45110 TaxID=1121369 RepID=A0ABR9ZM02_9CORY|nr:DUF4913 domain-containing protein [Corynebacterium suicordis]MBF4554387.1 DUF4913 domain-containing protein [Corynebacterium suicordis DSM 45110]MDR6278589.1 hypothetical protein [Corynebacterium suicordis]